MLTLEHTPNVGMFAAANQVLGNLSLFESGQLSGMVVDFEKNGLYYDPDQGTNWWGYYFEPISLGQKTNASIVYPTKTQYLEAWAQRRTLSREIAAYLIHKYVHIRPHLQQKFDDFAAQHFDSYMIGVHFRGTDKEKEAPRVAYEAVFEQIDSHIPDGKTWKLFIATDEADFLEEARERYHVVAIQAHRTDSNVGVHFLHKNSYVLGEEALMDAYLLSKCDLLIKTSSNLSLWSTYFNPDLPVIRLNQRYLPSLEPE